MKKTIALILALAMCFSLAACGGKSSGTSPSPNASSTANNPYKKAFKIGVIEAQANDESVARAEYFKNYLGPRYNVTFVFSEKVKSNDEVVTIVENFADAGCNAVIDYYAQTYMETARLCNKLKMIYVYNGTYRKDLYESGLDNFFGNTGDDSAGTGDKFREYLAANASADGHEGFLISSGLASTGNIAHKDITSAVLKALKDRYNLTFTLNGQTVTDMEKIAVVNTPQYLENNKNIKIYIYPGNQNADNYLPNASRLIQSGNFEWFISTAAAHTTAAQIIQEAEQSLGKNIKVMSIGSIGNQLISAMNNKDKFGNQSLDFATVKCTSIMGAAIFAVTYNILTGNTKNILSEDGKPVRYTFSQWGVKSADEVKALVKVDVAANKSWVADYSKVDSLLAVNNPNLTSAQFQKILDSMDKDYALSMAKKLG